MRENQSQWMRRLVRDLEAAREANDLKRVEELAEQLRVAARRAGAPRKAAETRLAGSSSERRA